MTHPNLLSLQRASHKIINGNLEAKKPPAETQQELALKRVQNQQTYSSTYDL